MIEEKAKCKMCGLECEEHHWYCDLEGGPWCDECWEERDCAKGIHGEGCPTQVFGGIEE